MNLASATWCIGSNEALTWLTVEESRLAKDQNIPWSRELPADYRARLHCAWAAGRYELK